MFEYLQVNDIDAYTFDSIRLALMKMIELTNLKTTSLMVFSYGSSIYSFKSDAQNIKNLK